MPLEPQGQRPRLGLKAVLRALVGIVAVGLAFYFLVSRLVRDWHQIPFHEMRFAPLPLIASFAVLIATRFPLEAFAWSRILRTMDERINPWRAMSIICVTQLGKYIPGKLWFTLGRASLAKRDGIPEAKTLVSVTVEIALSLLAALLLLAAAVPLLPAGTLPSKAYLLFILGPVCLVMVHPAIFNRLLRLALRWLKQPQFTMSLNYGGVLAITGLYLLDWVLQGIGSYLLINSFYPLPLARLPVLMGGYAVSWMIGFLILIAPAGLGVREGIFTLILKLIMPEPVAIVSVLVTRVWMTLSESIMAVVSLPVLRRSNHG